MSAFVQREFHYYDTWKKCSWDSSHDESMIESEKIIVNFDQAKTHYLNGLNKSEECAHSIDALGIDEDDHVCLIEFKNGAFSEKEIREKIIDSLLIFCDIAHTSISDTRNNMHFILVYNQERLKLRPTEERAINQARLGKTACPLYGLNKLDGFLFARGYMMSKELFQKRMIERIHT